MAKINSENPIHLNNCLSQTLQTIKMNKEDKMYLLMPRVKSVCKIQRLSQYDKGDGIDLNVYEVSIVAI